MIITKEIREQIELAFRKSWNESPYEFLGVGSLMKLVTDPLIMDVMSSREEGEMVVEMEKAVWIIVLLYSRIADMNEVHPGIVRALRCKAAAFALRDSLPPDMQEQSDGSFAPLMAVIEEWVKKELSEANEQVKKAGFVDAFGRRWKLPPDELCPECGQPDSVGDCNHQKLSDEEARSLGAIMEDECQEKNDDTT